MKVLKKFNKGIFTTDMNLKAIDSKALAASRAFDYVISRLNVPINFDKIEFHIDSENSSRIIDNMLILKIDYESIFVQYKYDKAIRALILIQLFDSLCNITAPPFIRKIYVNRIIIRNDFNEELMFYFYIRLLKKNKIKNIHDFLEINIPWLSFYGNELDSKFLRTMIIEHTGKYNCTSLFNSLKKNLSEPKNLQRAIEAYRRLMQ